MENNQPIRHKCCGPAGPNFFWQGEKDSGYHIRFEVRLDHEINGGMLQEAYEETMHVWPMLMDAFVEEDDGFLYFEENDRPLKVHHNPMPVAPGHGLNADRLLAVSYDGDTLYFSGMHVFFDGGSVMKLAKGVLCRYLKLYSGKDFPVQDLPVPGEGDKPEYYDFYMMREDILSLPYEYQEEVYKPASFAHEPGFAMKEKETYNMCRVAVNAQDFMKYCKENNASPSIMFFLLLAKTFYRLHPEETLPVTTNITRDIRSTLGLEMSIMGQAFGTDIFVEREDLEQLPLSEAAGKVKASMACQRKKDYLLSRVHDTMSTREPGEYIPSTIGTLAYLGRLDYGEYTGYIKDFSISYGTSSNVNIVDLNGIFHIDVQLGEATQPYAETLLKLFRENGIEAMIIRETGPIPSEVRE
ncbi:MAG: hypothetical protein HUJ72_03125 [Blautia sp.]|nr:hypothetical protein [Blautia sp.]